MGAIELIDLTKTFAGGVRAVDRVSLEIGDGEFLVLVGPSGCGKSTLLRMLAGIETVTSGLIRIDGQDATHQPPADRDIAMVFQNYALYPHMTAFDNLAFGLKLRKVPRPEIGERVTGVMRMLQLAKLERRRPGELSGGQRQRVAMGRAIVRQPTAFLMDEPLSNLDAKLRVAMRVELSQLHDRLGVTTIYVTHDQVEAMTLGDRVAVLRDGVLQQVDTPQNLFRRPANIFVAAFIGSPAINLVRAEVSDAALHFGGHSIPLPPGTTLQGRREVIVGIRPSHLTPGDRSDPELPRITVTVELIEDLGAEAHVIFPVDADRVDVDGLIGGDSADASDDVHLLADDQRSRFLAKVEEHHSLAAGQPIELAVDHRRLHFFEPSTGEAIPTAAPAPSL